MRERGTLFLYIIVLAIGCGFAGAFVYGVATGIITPDRFVYALIGAICAVYSIRQIIRPLPKRRARKADE
jgi:peptidoglycan/LPS O-acetylase OafA/YrhL